MEETKDQQQQQEQSQTPPQEQGQSQQEKPQEKPQEESQTEKPEEKKKTPLEITKEREGESSKVLGDAMYKTLLPIAEDYTTSVNQLLDTQQELSEKIDCVVADLNKIKGIIGALPAFNAYTKKLLASRSKVESLGKTLNSVEARISKMTTELRRLKPEAFTKTADKNEVPIKIDHKINLDEVNLEHSNEAANDDKPKEENQENKN